MYTAEPKLSIEFTPGIGPSASTSVLTYISLIFFFSELLTRPFVEHSSKSEQAPLVQKKPQIFTDSRQISADYP
jgi:hypothetical protein